MKGNFTILELPYGVVYDRSEDIVDNFEACQEYNADALHHIVKSIPFHDTIDGIDYAYYTHYRAMYAFPEYILYTLTRFITHALTGLTGNRVENRARVFNLFLERILYHPFTSNGISFDDFIGKHFLDIPEEFYTDEHYELLYWVWLHTMLGEFQEIREDYGIMNEIQSMDREENIATSAHCTCGGSMSIVERASYNAQREEYRISMDETELDNMMISDAAIYEMSHDERVELHQFNEFLLD